MNSKSFIRYKINTLSPIIISDRSGDANMINSKSYISGNNVLGIFANKYIYINKNKSSENKENINNINNKEFHNDDLFYDWFLNEKLLFTNGYISDEEETYFAPPISIKSDKYNESNIFDLFYDEDEASLKTLEKIDNFVSINNDSIKKNYVKKSLSFHHARDKKTGTAKKGDIFNYESISENQIFKGSIIGREEDLKNFVNMFGTKFITYIGKSKNSQYGKIEIELEYSLLEKQNYCPEIKTAEICSDDDSVVLTLLSDTIIYNENGFSAVNIYDFEKYLNKRLKDLLSDNNNNNNKVNNVSGYQDLKLTKAFIQKGKSEEFVGIWKLKNQSENVFSAGSCFLLEGLSLKYNHHEMLKKICIEGIGEKTHEGFGRAVCGWQNKIENYLIKDVNVNKDEKIENKKPECECQDFVANLIKNIIKDNLINVIIGNAMKDASSFKNTPSKSLMGKLQLLVRNDISGFKKKLDIIVGDDKPEKPAKIQLKNSHNNKKNMLDFIKDLIDYDNNNNADKFNIDVLKNKNSGLFENLDEFINDMKNDSNLINNLERVYFSTFFNFIRKNK